MSCGICFLVASRPDAVLMTPDNGFSTTGDEVQDWNLRLRLAVPDPIPDYFDRPALIERLLSTDQSIAVLKAPGGYGKTTLLATYCRLLAERNQPAGWLQIDAEDTRSSMETHLAFAFLHGGVDVPDPGSEAWRVAGDRVRLLLSVIAARAEPCALILDDLERLTDPGAARVLNTLLRNAPPNLYITMACRKLPLSLDIAGPSLAGRVITLTADDLRFSPQEAAAFLGKSPTRQELSAIDRQFEGWPVALALHSKSSHGNTAGRNDDPDLLGNWIEAVLWERLSTGQRDFLLDAGLLDRLDPVLLDEVLEGNASRYRLQSLPDLDGLIQPLQDNRHGAVLHPLLRRHCAACRIRETPERFQTIHHRAALALERRGDTIGSMRHAAQAGEPELLGRLIEDAGGLRLWARQVQPPLEEVVALLNHEVIKQWPRLALTYCYMLIATDRIHEARRLYELAAAGSDGFTRNPTGDIVDLRIDQFLVDIAFFLVGYTSIDSAELQSAVAGAYAIGREGELEPGTRAILFFGLCIYENHRARFDAAFECVEQMRQLVSEDQYPPLSLHIDIQLGGMAMARGHVREAETFYTSALRTARTHYPDDPTSGVIGDALLRELQFERNRLSLPIAAGMPLRGNITRPGNTFATHAAECAIVTETTQYIAGVDEALTLLTEMTEYARVSRRQTLLRYLAALRVATLARAGRAAEAERAWRAGALPSGHAECLNLQTLDWREMEMIACARLCLYVAGDAFEAGRTFSEKLLHVAKTHQLVRTEMRVYAILIALEWRAGDMDAACTHLKSFLHHYMTADYARPILREGNACREALEHFLDSHADGPLRSAATDLLQMIPGKNEKDSIVHLTDRELAILTLLPDLRDKQIAAELSISRDGVRYHLSRIFAKLGTKNRFEAVQRARTIGLLQQ